jgi:hypothetical protein
MYLKTNTSNRTVIPSLFFYEDMWELDHIVQDNSTDGTEIKNPNCAHYIWETLKLLCAWLLHIEVAEE